MPYSWVRTFTIVNSQMIYRVKGISIKILAAYFIEIDKLSL